MLQLHQIIFKIVNVILSVYLLNWPYHWLKMHLHRTDKCLNEGPMSVVPLRMSSLPSSTRSEVRSFSPMNCWKPSRFRQRVPRLQQQRANSLPTTVFKSQTRENLCWRDIVPEVSSNAEQNDEHRIINIKPIRDEWQDLHGSHYLKEKKTD